MPDPPGTITITAADRPEPVCDFCGGTDPVWRYPCGDFDLAQFDTGSVGDWSACSMCAEIIESIPLPIHGNRAAVERMADLSKRSLDHAYPDGPDEASTGDLLAMATFLFFLHSGFLDHRLGPRSPEVGFRPDEPRPGAGP